MYKIVCAQQCFGHHLGASGGFWSRVRDHWILKVSQHRSLKKEQKTNENNYIQEGALTKTWSVEEAWNGKQKVFALHLLQIKRFRRPGKLIENGSPNCIKKVSKLKPLASKVRFFEILMFLGARKRRTQKITHRFWAVRNRGTGKKGGERRTFRRMP